MTRAVRLSRRSNVLIVGALVVGLVVAGSAAHAAGSGTTSTCTQSDDGVTATWSCPSTRTTVTATETTTATATETTTATATATATRTVTATVPGPTVTVTAAPSATPSLTQAGPALPAGWTRTTFLDDFTAGLAQWNARNNTWASNEQSIDTNRPANLFLTGGVLTERAQRETYTAFSTTRAFTSAYLDTVGKFSQQYGRWEIRAKLPAARGLWPAFWLRGDKGLGELDVLEAVGGTGTTVQTIHQSTNGGQGKAGHEDRSVTDLTGWHVYAAEREPGVARWYIDNRLIFTVTPTQAPWLDTTFNEPMNMRLNLQVGGSMPTYYGLNVDQTTPFPADLAVDYVRVLAR